MSSWELKEWTVPDSAGGAQGGPSCSRVLRLLGPRAASVSIFFIGHKLGKWPVRGHICACLEGWRFPR